jgi:hypothetical protein
MAWTIAVLSVGAAVFATNARQATTTAPATMWVRTEAAPVHTTAPTTTLAGTSATAAAGTAADASSPNIVAVPGTATVPVEVTATVPAETTAPPTTVPEAPAIVARPIPDDTPDAAPEQDAPAWAATVRTTSAGYIATDVGCASGTSAAALDAFFTERLGPIIGEDYQHVVALGGDRYLWLFQDTFIDQGGSATRLNQASFVHNVALVQEGSCFTMYHRGSAAKPASFDPGTGEKPLQHWFWPMGGETVDGQVHQYWVEMVKDAHDPGPGDGLGWHPASVWLATYDAQTLARIDFQPAANSGVSPVYGYAVASDDSYTYLFGNTFEQNFDREGGYFNGPHSGTRMYLARVARGRYTDAPEYRTADGWSSEASAATPIVSRYWAENPMQPRYLNGQWVAATKVDGYWGEELSIDVAIDPWGPWSNTDRRPLSPRGGDPRMNTYHAHLMPWLSGGALVVSVSQNARNMERDAFPHPERYRLQFFSEPLVAPSPPDTTVPETSTTVPDTTTTVPDTTTSTTTTTTSTTTSTTSTTSTTTTIPPSSSSSSTSSSSSSSTSSSTSSTVEAPDTSSTTSTADGPP